jgi:hypothetical protein
MRPLICFEIFKSLILLLDVESNNELCIRLASLGPGSLRREEITPRHLDILSKSSVVTFEAIAAGRNTPIFHENATEKDIASVIDHWKTQDGVSEQMAIAFLGNDTSNPSYCQGTISFQKSILEQSSDAANRVLVYLTGIVAAE